MGATFKHNNSAKKLGLVSEFGDAPDVMSIIAKKEFLVLVYIRKMAIIEKVVHDRYSFNQGILMKYMAKSGEKLSRKSFYNIFQSLQKKRFIEKIEGTHNWAINGKTLEFLMNFNESLSAFSNSMSTKSIIRKTFFLSLDPAKFFTNNLRDFLLESEDYRSYFKIKEFSLENKKLYFEYIIFKKQENDIFLNFEVEFCPDEALKNMKINMILSYNEPQKNNLENIYGGKITIKNLENESKSALKTILGGGVQSEFYLMTFKSVFLIILDFLRDLNISSEIIVDKNIFSEIILDKDLFN